MEVVDGSVVEVVGAVVVDEVVATAVVVAAVLDEETAGSPLLQEATSRAAETPAASLRSIRDDPLWKAMAILGAAGRSRRAGRCGATAHPALGARFVSPCRLIVPGMGLKTLSPSRAGDFKSCPQLFKFRAIDHLPEPTTVYQARGTTAHRALQRLFDLPAAQRTPPALYDLFRAAWAEVRLTEEYEGLFASLEEERAWGLESLSILANYFNVEDPTAIEPLEREMDMLEDLDGITIRGILDRMEARPDGSLVISDYKTGKAPPEQYALPAFFALKIYALLIRRRMGRAPDAVRLIYLGGPNGPVVYEIPVNDAQLDAMDRQLRALWSAIDRAIAREDFPPRPGPLCDWCSFRDICPAWVRPAGTAEPEAPPPAAAD